MFPFTFKISVPGIVNPFSAQNGAPPSSNVFAPGQPNQVPDIAASINNRKSVRRQRPPTGSTSPVPQVLRKRGWEPSFAEPSLSTTTLASSSGYLDTPSKYRDMAEDEFHEIEAMAAGVLPFILQFSLALFHCMCLPCRNQGLTLVQLLAHATSCRALMPSFVFVIHVELPPPAKRRRGLAGTIVSTALSAALIGTAVGITVYRLWRDRGKETARLLQPPPPYQEGEWSAPEAPVEEPKALNVIPSTPRRKRHTVGSIKRTHSLRRTPLRASAYSSPPSQPAPFFPSTSHRPTPEDSVEDQIDWIGDKLTMLIEEGKKALGREVVVMSEDPADEVDDGNDDWEEDDVPRTSRRSASPRKRRPHDIFAPPSYSSAPPSASPRTTRFDLGSQPIPIAGSNSRSKDGAEFMSTPSSFKFGDDPQVSESPLLRESMEQARARVLRNRGL
ncbi:uncharacterized protein BT62DRAFT_981715 [Guyanagaster necrorhizus]|uniref:Uncharacterized protein n=1 Tax=Guyanagaster necrorhizus TaxID=856835 RepID=A0A9P8AQN1_9AGAR|nr:uncharacterized protein BT62DRAFT_981715 [Guyanagaster necrorhizus MCA 3950]KAG7444528.1 hypothetical protein BT62DRAFT_981715 [Guyanagaster necrorhizus MCA 3950]